MRVWSRCLKTDAAVKDEKSLDNEEDELSIYVSFRLLEMLSVW